jgi:hypothetical protein
MMPVNGPELLYTGTTMNIFTVQSDLLHRFSGIQEMTGKSWKTAAGFIPKLKSTGQTAGVEESGIGIT